MLGAVHGEAARLGEDTLPALAEVIEVPWDAVALHESECLVKHPVCASKPLPVEAQVLSCFAHGMAQGPTVML